MSPRKSGVTNFTKLQEIFMENFFKKSLPKRTPTRREIVAAAVARQRPPSPPKRKNKSPPKNKNKNNKRRASVVSVGARVPIAHRIVTLPNGRRVVEYFVTNEYFPIGPNGKPNFRAPMR